MKLTEAIYQLFVVEQQVRGLEQRLTGARRYSQNQQIKIDQLSQQRDEIFAQLRHAQTQATTLEKEANSIEARIEQLRQRMNSASTNKEYSALLTEVNTIKIEKAKAEELALVEMAKVETLKEKHTALESNIADQMKIKQKADEELAQRQGEVGERLSELKAQRDKTAEGIPSVELTVFNRLNDQFEGEAMAQIEEVDRRRLEYSCGGCYISIPMEKVSQLVSGDKVVQCPSCKRILFLEKEMRDNWSVGK